jgi:hypothetical protein
MRHLFSAFTLLTLLALPGCNVEGCTDDAPAPPCFSGKVVGTACMDGALIEVDGAFAIGKPFAPYTNLVAAVNINQTASPDLTIDGQVVQIGQVIYFTYTPSEKAREAVCPQNTVPLPIPHLTLSNVSTTACPSASGAQ